MGQICQPGKQLSEIMSHDFVLTTQFDTLNGDGMPFDRPVTDSNF